MKPSPSVSKLNPNSRAGLARVYCIMAFTLVTSPDGDVEKQGPFRNLLATQQKNGRTKIYIVSCQNRKTSIDIERCIQPTLVALRQAHGIVRRTVLGMHCHGGTQTTSLAAYLGNQELKTSPTERTQTNTVQRVTNFLSRDVIVSRDIKD